MFSILSDRCGSQRCCTKNALLIVLIVLVALVSGQVEYSQEDLEAMTEVELEAICVTRGFQLVNDEADELTKQDYIEAAQRCLAIEQEMNELLVNYPELADELEEEIKRMEKENAEKQAYAESLQENRIPNDSTDNNQNDPGMAFVPQTNGRGSEHDEVGDEDLAMSDEVPLDEPTDDLPSTEDEEVKPSTTTNSDDTQQDEDIDDSDVEDLDEITPAGTDIESKDTSTKKEDLTLTHIAIESLRVLVKNAQDDVKRIINLAIPVLQPFFVVGDAAWQQMKTLFVKACEAYEAYQATNMPASEETAVAETCDDSV